MVKDHLYSENGNPLSVLGLLVLMNHHTDRILHTMACKTSCGALTGTTVDHGDILEHHIKDWIMSGTL